MTLKKSKGQQTYIPLALRDIVVFPHSIVPLFVGRPKSIDALRKAAEENSSILLLTQKDPSIHDPAACDLFSVGTLARVLQLAELPDGSLKALVEGIERIEMLDYKNPLAVVGKSYPTVIQSPTDAEVLHRLVLKELTTYLKLSKRKVTEPLSSIEQVDTIEKAVDLIIPQLPMELVLKQQILEEATLEKRLDALLTYLSKEIGILQVEKNILQRMQKTVVNQQEEYVKRIKNQAIREEFGDDELGDLERKIRATPFPDEVAAKAESELKKLKAMHTMSAEATVVRNYLDCLLSLPWAERSELLKDLDVAEAVLSNAHYGLGSVKKKILEFLAVQNRTGTVQGAVLCFSGPPGVGKTSLAKAIAEATNREFVRMSLGGVRDEANIRGHRRTYVGAMPGQVVQGMIKAKTKNPLFLLDEIDKLSSDGLHGNPADALLELLDPVQNNFFKDHYLDLPFDFSEVFFICTANYIQNIPAPLRDRLEFVDISSYTEDEKVKIAQLHLIPAQKKKAGLKEGEFQISEAALRELIRRYCQEAGVRELERRIASLARHAVLNIDRSKTDRPLTQLHLTVSNLSKHAGQPQFQYGQASKDKDKVGVVYGLAFTGAGGDLLCIQVVTMPRIQGAGAEPSFTGNLGNIMKESIKLAITVARSNAEAWGIDPSKFANDLHVHVPDGAVPKEGPSAGVTLFTALVSALTGIPARRDVAMTGEISLTGDVGRIGGLKEKLLAAQRGGIKTVLIPSENASDLEDVPENIKKELRIIPVHTVKEVLEHALVTEISTQSQTEAGEDNQKESSNNG